MDDEQEYGYWADCASEHLPEKIGQRFDDYWDWMEGCGRLDMIRQTRRAYFGLDEDGGYAKSSAIVPEGERGELHATKVNHLRAYGKSLLSLTTGTRPSYRSRAINADPESMRQSHLADDILDYYASERRMEDVARRAAELAYVDSEGWVHAPWNFDAGEVMSYTEEPVYDENGDPVYEDEDPELEGDGVDDLIAGQRQRTQRKPVHEGEIDVEVFSGTEVARPVPVPNGDLRPPWVIIRDARANRWDLTAQYPEVAEEIEDLPSGTERELFATQGAGEDISEDSIEVLTFYHERTPAMPEGRMAKVAGDVLLFDGPLPFARIPTISVSPSIEHETGCGYTPAWDLLGLQRMTDSAVSTAISNHDAFGVQRILAPRGCNVKARDLARGLGFIHYDPQQGQKPEPLDLLHIDESTFRLMDWGPQQMGELVGINEAARGKIEGVKSGAHAALLVQQALKFNSDFEGSWTRLLEDLGTTIIEHLQRFAHTERMVQITGKNRGPTLQSFKADDLRNIKRVAVELGTTIERNPQARMEMAQSLLQNDKIDLEQFFEVIETGRIEPLYDASRSFAALIREENAQLLQGKPQPVYALDDHARHIQEHVGALSHPIVRESPQIAQVIHGQILEHDGEWRRMTMENPGLLVALGYKPHPDVMARQQAQGGGPPGPGGPPGAQPPQGGPPGPPQPPDGGPPAGAPQPPQAPPAPVGGPPPMGKPDGPARMPNMPKQARTPSGETVLEGE